MCSDKSVCIGEVVMVVKSEKEPPEPVCGPGVAVYIYILVTNELG